MRLAVPFLLSFNLHVWCLAVLSFPGSGAEKIRRPVERQSQPPRLRVVELIKLPPASRVGELGNLAVSPTRSLFAAGTPAPLQDPPEVRAPAALAQRPLPPASGKAARPKEPSVSYRVRVARGESASHPERAEPFRTSQHAALLLTRGSPAPLQPDRRFLATASPSAAIEAAVDGVRPPGSSAVLYQVPTGAEIDPRRGAGDFLSSDAAGAAAGGDTRPRLQIIQARIDEITPLIHHTTRGCELATGLLRIRFTMGPAGYTHQVRVVSSSGNPCLDSQIATILHLAEPYPYLEGWIPVTMKFQR
jgi:hypothetical protein